MTPEEIQDVPIEKSLASSSILAPDQANPYAGAAAAAAAASLRHDEGNRRDGKDTLEARETFENEAEENVGGDEISFSSEENNDTIDTTLTTDGEYMSS